MENLQWVIIVGFLAIFGGIVYWMIRSERDAQERKVRFSEALGFTPTAPKSEIIEKITRLYQSVRFEKDRQVGDRYELQNVSIRKIVDGEMVVFDLIDTSGEDDSHLENQAVAIHSPELNLPPFSLFPKTDQEGALANAANKVLSWLVSVVGDPVDFSDHPAFERRYLVSSPQPEAVRRFLDETKIRLLLGTSLLTLHAGGDIFSLSRIEMGAQPLSQEVLSDRVNQAMNLFSVFQS